MEDMNVGELKPVAAHPDTIETEEFKLDRPLIVRYGYYLADLGRGDLGRSFTGRDVSEQLVAAFPATVRLALLAVLIEVLLGVTIGVVAALRPGKAFDTTTMMVGLGIIAFPSFVIANLAQLVFDLRDSEKWGAALRSISIDPRLLAEGGRA